MDFMDIVKSSFFGQYKAHSRSMISSEGGKNARIKSQADKRQSKRIDAFISSRGLDIVEKASQPPTQKIDLRKKQMLQWREDRLRRKKMEPKKPPPFKAGTVTHAIVPFQEPLFKKVLKGVTSANDAIRRVTRSTTRARKEEPIQNKPIIKAPAIAPSFAPLGAKFHAPKIIITEKKPTKSTPKARSNGKLFGKFFPKKDVITAKGSNKKYTKASGDSQKSSAKGKKRKSGNIRKSLPRKIFSQEDGHDDSSSKSKRSSKSTPIQTPQKLNSSSNTSDNLDLSVSSPYVTVARGKGNRHRESICKLKLGYSDVSPEKSAQHLRSQLDDEVTRLRGLCDTWKSYQDENESDLMDESKDLINLAIGQTQLLMSKKLQQFRGLIDQCEKKEERIGEGIVTVEDLQGFWDMVFMQVVNVDVRFKRLEELKMKGWQEDDQPQAEVSKKVTVVKSKPATKNPQSSIALKAMIQAARNRSKQNTKKSPTVMDSLSAEPSNMKTFDGIFFSVTSPSKNTDGMSRSPATPPLRRSVISSEAKKHITSMTSPNAMAVVRATSAVRSVTNPDDSFRDNQLSVSHIDLKKTPGKGILKTPGTTKKPSNPGSSHKNVKVIFFENNESSEDNDGKTTHDTSESVDEKSPEIKKTYRQSKRNKAQPKDENAEPDDKRTTRSRKSSHRLSSTIPLSEQVLESESNIVRDDSNSTKKNSRINSTDRKIDENPLSTVSPFTTENMKTPKTNTVPQRLTRKRSMDDRKSVNLITFDTPDKPTAVTRRQLRR